jgi:hypothetical protein
MDIPSEGGFRAVKARSGFARHFLPWGQLNEKPSPYNEYW